MFCRYAVVNQATGQIEEFCSRRNGWDGADAVATKLARDKGGRFFIVKIVASTEVYIKENKPDA